ncbi:nuclear distribution protein nudE homolog 1 isoform X3 [Patella vulgata]|uniref:nuclear distribution protein nudE homolog 1 isoform X3 n=1 Tax=Patella vulgata TaxID=6465 RepID=UPI00217FA14D|nr:nuclear distribution protein nudE homolog 1 isoform X3 [Patella vulgata]
MTSEKKFATPQEEICYWRDQAQKFKQELEETKEELEEFQISSKELEDEMETQLKQFEKKNTDLESSNSRLKQETETLRDKLESLQAGSHRRICELEDELDQIRVMKENFQKYIREIEQANDDLERSKRATVVSLEDFEARLNQAIERNAFLESELDEKETLAETVQRLRDEARDLKQELHVREVIKSPEAGVDTPQEKLADSGYSSKVVHSDPATPTTPTTPTSLQGRGLPGINGNLPQPLTPSARISALNIVGDLLRKVGALESKLASCRKYVKDPPRSGKPAPGSPLDSPRMRRFNRGGSVQSQGMKISS